MNFVCPHCLHGIANNGERCPQCGRVFLTNEWPCEAYTSEGLISELIFFGNERSWQAQAHDFVIGRQPGTYGLQLESPTVSRKHVQVKFDSFGNWCAESLGSPFFWNDEPKDTVILTSGGYLTLGACILRVGLRFQLKTPQTVPCGRLLEGGECALPEENGILRIGSSPECEIVIEGAEPVHALIYRNRKEQSWWVTDKMTNSGTFVNGQAVRNSRLAMGDCLTIASVPLFFERDGLHGNRSAARDTGSLLVQELSVQINERQILKDISFSANSGEFIGIIGPSGCGKSSLIQRLASLAPISSGAVLVNGQELESVRRAFLQKTAYLPQQVVLHSNLTLKQEFQCFCRLHTPSYEQSRKDILPVLTCVGLEQELAKKISDLSGGQQRRAGIALELLRSPDLLLLDEPTAGLDPASEGNIMTYLRRIANQGKTVICSTHLMENFQLFDKVLLLNHGQEIFFGSPNELLAYWKAKTPREIFQQLSNESPNDAQMEAVRFRNSPYFQMPRPEKPTSFAESPQPSFGQEFTGYLYRYWNELVHFRNSVKPVREFLFSRSGILFLVQPLLISQVIKFACAPRFYYEMEVRDVLFFMIISVFWLGLNNAVRELVAERVPYRCLERLEQRAFTSYICSKYVWCAGLCLIQTVLFSVFFFALPDYPVWWKSPESVHELVLFWSPGISFLLFVVCLLGSWVALAVSAVSRNENFAVGLLPVILIPILLFSCTVMKNEDTWNRGFENEVTEDCSVPAIYCEWLSPCHPPLVLMEKVRSQNTAMRLGDEFSEKSKEKENALWKCFRESVWLMVNTFVWFVVTFAVTVHFQEKNESAWKGR